LRKWVSFRVLSLSEKNAVEADAGFWNFWWSGLAVVSWFFSLTFGRGAGSWFRVVRVPVAVAAGVSIVLEKVFFVV